MTYTDEEIDELLPFFPWGGDPRNRQSVRIIVFDECDYDEEFNVDEFIKKMTDARGEIPIEFLADAKVSLYGASGAGHLQISYMRNETDDELNIRVARDVDMARRRKAQEEARTIRVEADEAAINRPWKRH